MAIPSTRDGFKDYCKRALGFGVIDINVSDAQVEDRIDEGLQYFAQYHYDGVERMYLKYKITEDDITRAIKRYNHCNRYERWKCNCKFLRVETLYLCPLLLFL